MQQLFWTMRTTSTLKYAYTHIKYMVMYTYNNILNNNVEAGLSGIMFSTRTKFSSHFVLLLVPIIFF